MTSFGVSGPCGGGAEPGGAAGDDAEADAGALDDRGVAKQVPEEIEEGVALGLDLGGVLLAGVGDGGVLLGEVADRAVELADGGDGDRDLGGVLAVKTAAPGSTDRPSAEE